MSQGARDHGPTSPSEPFNHATKPALTGKIQFCTIVFFIYLSFPGAFGTSLAAPLGARNLSRRMSAWACVKSSPGRGRGVFATRNIPSRTVIDVSPVILFSAEEYDKSVASTVLREYTFVWRGKSDPTARGASCPPGFALAVAGLGSMFNHARRPNCGWLPVTDEDDEFAPAIKYIALSNIAEGEEVFICYAPQDALWFIDTGANYDSSQDEAQDEDVGNCNDPIDALPLGNGA